MKKSIVLFLALAVLAAAQVYGNTVYDGKTATISGDKTYSKTVLKAANGANVTGSNVTGGTGGAATGGDAIGANGAAAQGAIFNLINKSNLTFSNNIIFSNNTAIGGIGGTGTGGTGTGGRGSNGSNSSWAGGNGGDGGSGRGGNGTGGNAGNAQGGVLFLNTTSKITFNQNASFINNTAVGAKGGDGKGGTGIGGAGGSGGSGWFQDGKNGGAGFGYGGNGKSGNGSSAYGGALFLSGASQIIFNGSADLSKNTVIGAFAAGNASVGTGANGNGTAANGNAGALARGGAIYIEKNSKIDFKGAYTNISTNTAPLGAAIYAISSSKIDFTGTNLEISYNNSTNDNGIIYWDSSSNINLTNAASIKAVGNQANNGGFLYLLNKGTITLNGDIEMTANKARSGYGGSLYISSTALNINGANKTIKFQSHNNTYGGAIYIIGNSLNIAGSNAKTIFSSNKASQGAAIYAKNAALIFNNGSFEFSSNNSTADNGIIRLEGSANINFSGATEVKANKNQANIGGFLYLVSKDISFNGNVNISNNSARTGSGGALYLDKSNLTVNGVNKQITFNGNKALTAYGGAIYMNANSANFSDNASTVSFINNTALDGAAIYAISKAKLLFSNGTLEFTGNNSINGNGIIYLDGTSSLDLSKTITLKAKNNRGMNGGFLYLSSKVKLDINANVEMDANISSSGYGGSFYFNATDLNLIGENKSIKFLNHNNANGGAIYIANASLNIGAKNSIVSFINNTAQKGAIIYANNSPVFFKDADLEFINNNSVNSNSIMELTNGSNLSFNNISSIKAVNNQGTNGGFLYLSSKGKLDINANVEMNANVSRSGYGGSFYFNATDLNLTGENKSIKFLNHNNANGGAIYITNANLNIGAKNSIVSFINNTAQKGAIIYANNSPVFFKDADLEFINNNSINSNSIIELENSAYLSFDNISNIKAVNNQSNNGGFLYLSSIAVNINNKIEMSSNAARNHSGGAIYGQNLFFKAKDGIFANNYARYFGGALYAIDKSEIVLNDISFLENSSLISGGAAYLDDSTIEVHTLKADNNQSNSGGFLYLSSGAMTINKKAEMSRNAAQYGGALYAADGSKLIFNDISFLQNSASELGGAIYADELFFKAKSGVFANNHAGYSGGALYAAYKSELVLKDISFLQNSAGKFGGAIFIDNSNLEIAADKNDVIFDGNKAKNKDNDIYMQTNGILSLYSAKDKKIVFSGGIITDDTSEIIKTGEGYLFLQGNSQINSKFTINNGLVSTKQKKLLIGKLIIGTNGVYYGEKYGKNVYKTLVGDAEIYGTIGIASDFTDNQSDMMIASTKNAAGAQGKITIGTSSYLIIDGDRIHTIGYSTMTIFEADEITGKFNFNAANSKNIDYRLEYYPNRIDLIIRRWSDFAEMEGLSKNQKEIAFLLDNISKDYKTTAKNMNDIISSIYFIDSQKNRLRYIDKLSGAFIANVLNAALDYDDAGNIYQRLNRDSFSDASNQIWLQTGALSKNYNASDNLGERFSYYDYSIAGGMDILKNKNLVLGAYLQYDSQKFKQEQSRGKSNNYEIGAYGMKEFLLNRSSIFLKADMAFGFQNYSLNRNIELINKTYSADSSFRTNTFQIAAQGEYTYNKYLSFFAGLNSVFLTNPNIKEKGGEWLDLEISNGTNIRISGIFGANAAGEYKKLNWNVKVYGRPILSGAESAIKIHFAQSDIGQKSEIYSVKDGFSAGIFGNIEYPISNSISVFFNNDLNIGESAYAYSFNIGLNYKLPIKTSSEISEIENKFKKARKLFNKQKYLTAGDLLSEIIAENPNFMQAQELFKKTNSYVEYNLDKGSVEERLYAKAYFSYFDKDYSDACEQWYRYIQYKNDNEEVADYYNKTNALLKSSEDNIRKEASSDKAERLFKNAVNKFNKMLWTVCIKDMEKLQDFVQKEKLNNAAAYNKKAKDYIDACIKQLSLNMQEGQKENKIIINEEEANAKYNEGLALYADGKYLEAQRLWELTLRLNPNHKKAKTAIANLENSGHISKP